MAVKDGFVYIGFWKRVLAAIIDAAIGIPLIPLSLFINNYAYANRSILFNVIYSVLWTVLWMWLIVRFGGTPGKLVIGARVVNDKAEYLSWMQAFRRMLFPYILMSLNTFCIIYFTVHGYPDGAVVSTLAERAQLVNEYGQPFNSINMILGLLVYVDILVILTNKQKRAIHDFIAGSYVITKESYTAVTNQDIVKESDYDQT